MYSTCFFVTYNNKTEKRFKNTLYIYENKIVCKWKSWICYGTVKKSNFVQLFDKYKPFLQSQDYQTFLS